MERYFKCYFIKESGEWRTTAFDETKLKMKPIQIKVKIRDGKDIYEGVTMAFYEGADHTSCHFIDILTGKNVKFKRTSGWEIKAA